MKQWTPSFANMCSMEADVETIRRRHAEHLAYYGATGADCQLVDLEPAKTWEKGVKCHWRLNINSYLGWKVYMLHTGCFASNPEYEEEKVGPPQPEHTCAGFYDLSCPACDLGDPENQRSPEDGGVFSDYSQEPDDRDVQGGL